MTEHPCISSLPSTKSLTQSNECVYNITDLPYYWNNNHCEKKIGRFFKDSKVELKENNGKRMENINDNWDYASGVYSYNT